MRETEKPILLPEPRNITLTGGYIEIGQSMQELSDGDLDTLAVAGDLPEIHFRVNENYPHGSESYQLTISQGNADDKAVISIISGSKIGTDHALRTLAQLLIQYDRKLPYLTIEDYPSFPVRGVMLDISRDRVPTMQELLHTVDLFASWKINHLQLYTEHTFAYRDHEIIWRNASPITPDEMQNLDNHCRKRGITLAANQNCFGHMHRWLQHEPYSHLAETDDEWYFDGQRRTGPFSLSPAEKGSISLVKDLLSQLLPNFSSKLVNIGCDETYDVGQGKSRAAVEKYGYASVYSDFVNQVAEIARQHGFQSMFWADIGLNHPEALNRLPSDMIALVWGYEPDTPFENWCRQLTDQGFQCWVCPGTSSWRSITGRTYERRENIIAAAVEGSKSNADGFLITDWGDMGHHQQRPISIHALAEAANAAWNAESARKFNPKASSLFAFKDDSGDTGRWLNELGNVDMQLRRTSGAPDEKGKPSPLRNSSALFKDLHTPLTETKLTGDIDAWRDVKDRLNDLLQKVPLNLDTQTVAELKHTLEVAMFTVNRAIIRREPNGLSESNQNKLIKRIQNIITEHRRLWLLRSRPGGLDDSCSYYENTLMELQEDLR
ncbi:family 20 glycosylhydrolase [bacterium]|nr:family 20 glycosylhydrolase [bacterium]